MVRSSLILAALFLPSFAHAQYANRSLGIGPHVSVDPESRAVRWGLTLESSTYLDNGFELFARVPVLIAEVVEGAATESGRGRVFATGGSAGVRYLFAEGMVRPWVGLQLSGVALLTQPVTGFFGPGATLGLDWILDESWSVGARGIYDVFIDLNYPWHHQLGGSLMVSVHF